MPSLLPLSRQFYITQLNLHKACNPAAPNHSSYITVRSFLLLLLCWNSGPLVERKSELIWILATRRIQTKSSPSWMPPERWWKLYNKSDRGFWYCNRVGLPCIKPDKKMNRCDFQIFSTSDKRILTIKWIDNNRAVHIVPNYSSYRDVGTVTRRNKSFVPVSGRHKGQCQYGRRILARLTCANLWNFGDRSFYFRLGFNSFDQSIVNSMITWNAIHPEINVSGKDFRFSVAESIVADFSSRSRQPSSNKRKTTLAGLEERPSVSASADLPVMTSRRRC